MFYISRNQFPYKFSFFLFPFLPFCISSINFNSCQCSKVIASKHHVHRGTTKIIFNVELFEQVNSSWHHFFCLLAIMFTVQLQSVARCYRFNCITTGYNCSLFGNVNRVKSLNTRWAMDVVPLSLLAG